jgi:tRNA modification GTPase
MADLSDTICALSTPSGRSGLAVVRVSGTKSLEIYRKLFKSKKNKKELKQRIVTLGHIVDPCNGNVIDEANAVCYLAPKSYTGEDMTEYSIHGSPVLLRHCFIPYVPWVRDWQSRANSQREPSFTAKWI